MEVRRYNVTDSKFYSDMSELSYIIATIVGT